MSKAHRFALVWVVVVVSGCSGSRSGETSTTTAPSTTRPPTTLAATTTLPAATTTAIDTLPPELTVIDPQPDSVVDRSIYTFRGTTEPGATVIAAGRYEADVAADGSWSVILVLSEGGNRATFTATDAAGNEARLDLQVEYHPTFEGDCGDLPRDVIPDDVSDLVAGFGDVDGDGAQDTISLYASGDSAYLHFALAYGWSVQGRIGRTRPAAIEGVFDLGGAVVMLQLDDSSDGSAYGLYAMHGCEIVAVSKPDGSIPTLFAGFRDTDAGWFTCDPDGVTQVLAFADGPSTRVQIHEYRYDAGPATVTEIEATDETEPGGLSVVTQRLLGVYPSCVST